VTVAALIHGHIEWECPNCETRDVTPLVVPNRYHTCPGLHNLVAPLVRAGTRCKITALERGDYLNGEVQRTGDDGKPYGAVVTERDDGNDWLAFAPLAQASAEGLGLR